MISVIMPAYNEEAYIRQAIRSVVNQTHKDWELIVVNDCSTDGTGDILRKLGNGVLYDLHNEENIGHTKSLNKALRYCRGDYIAMHDADDRSHPTRFAKQVKVLEQGIGLVSTYGVTINKDGTRIRDFYTDEAQRKGAKTIKRKLKDDCWILGPSMMWTREVFEKIGYFDESLYFGNDANYWARAMKYFKWTRVEEELYEKRRHPNQVRNKHPELEGTNWHKKAIQRAEECPIIKPT